jgi:hypothetical protein
MNWGCCKSITYVGGSGVDAGFADRHDWRANLCFLAIADVRRASAFDAVRIEQRLCTMALFNTVRRDVPPISSPVGARAGHGNAVFGSPEVRLARQHALRVATPTVHQR